MSKRNHRRILVEVRLDDEAPKFPRHLDECETAGPRPDGRDAQHDKGAARTEVPVKRIKPRFTSLQEVEIADPRRRWYRRLFPAAWLFLLASPIVAVALNVAPSFRADLPFYLHAFTKVLVYYLTHAPP